MAGNWQQRIPSTTAYWMSRVLYDIHHQDAHLQRYQANPDLYMADIALAPSFKAAIRDNDIGAMYLAGVNPYLLRAHCLGLHIPEKTFVESLKAIVDSQSAGAQHG